MICAWNDDYPFPFLHIFRMSRWRAKKSSEIMTQISMCPQQNFPPHTSHGWCFNGLSAPRGFMAMQLVSLTNALCSLDGLDTLKHWMACGAALILLVPYGDRSNQKKLPSALVHWAEAGKCCKTSAIPVSHSRGRNIGDLLLFFLTALKISEWNKGHSSWFIHCDSVGHGSSPKTLEPNSITAGFCLKNPMGRWVGWCSTFQHWNMGNRGKCHRFRLKTRTCGLRVFIFRLLGFSWFFDSKSGLHFPVMAKISTVLPPDKPTRPWRESCAAHSVHQPPQHPSTLTITYPLVN